MTHVPGDARCRPRWAQPGFYELLRHHREAAGICYTSGLEAVFVHGSSILLERRVANKRCL
jgi:hypothetical protein